MSIEALLTSLKESIDRNTAALQGAAAPASAPAEKAGKTEKQKTDEPKVTQEQMNAALIKIKDDFGMEHAKAIVKDVGGVAKMAEIKPAKYQAVYDAAVAKHAELTAAASNEGDI